MGRKPKREGVYVYMGFPGGSVVKNPPVNSGDTGLIPGLGRSPGGGNGNPLQCSCLENPMDRGAWCIYKYMADSFCCITETNTTL